MITVKSMRPAVARDPRDGELYAAQQEPKSPSRVPAILALALTAVVVYVKSLFLHNQNLEASPAFAGPAEDVPLALPDSLSFAPAAEDEAAEMPAGSALTPLTADGDEGLASLQPTAAVFIAVDAPRGSGQSGQANADTFWPLASGMIVDAGPGARGDRNPASPDVSGTGSGVSQARDTASGRGGDVISDTPVQGKGPTGDGEAPAGKATVPVRPLALDPVVPGARNRAPQVNGAISLADMAACHMIVITALSLLAGAQDADGDTLRVTNLTVSSGELTPVVEGWRYHSEENFFGTVTFSYDITDGTDTIRQTASARVVAVDEMVGTLLDDVILGTDCADVIDARQGNDIVDSRAGNDTVSGGSGNDNIVAGPGADIVYGGDGDDIIFGSGGNDLIFGGAGNDMLYGEDGDDVIDGEDGDDLIFGGSGNDQLSGGAGRDVIWGEDGDDVIAAGSGNDVVLGGAGADLIDGGAGNDSLGGGAGNDHIIGGAGADSISGDGGDDIIDAGDGDDVVDGGSGADVILAGAGDDLVTTGDGNSLVIGGAGADTIQGGAGADLILAGAGNDRVAAGAGADRLLGEGGDDILSGDAGDDVVMDGAGADLVDGGLGDDIIVAAIDMDSDTYDGGAGFDTIDLSETIGGILVDLVDGVMSGGDIGRDTIRQFEAVIGGSGNDRFVVGTEAMILTGGNGNDTFTYEAPSGHGQGRNLIQEILDLEPGDRIVVRQFEIRDQGATGNPANASVADAYGDSSSDARPFRFRIEKAGEADQTFVDVYVEQSEAIDFTIMIDGFHRLQSF